jgi:iron complex outermembrane receptor protein
LAFAAPIFAQRAEENVITSSKDAFGTTIGTQTVGLYTQNDARGFNPQQAGNLRIEGLYFDQQTFAANPCMVRETTMRIGIATQTYSFPSPTGIADFSLRTPTEGLAFSGSVSRGPFNGDSVQLEEQFPIASSLLGADVCGGYLSDSIPDGFRHDDGRYAGVTLRWHPAGATEVVPFWSYFKGRGAEVLPTVFTDGTARLPRFREVDLASQSWEHAAVNMTTVGIVVKSALLDHWKIDAGLFHSLEDDPVSLSPYYLLGQRGIDSAVDASPPLKAQSTSGEIRLTGAVTQGGHRHELQLAMRGRAVSRSFGGDTNIDFGNISLFDHTALLEPPIALGLRSDDRTRQVDIGATYEERWRGVGSAAFGVLKSTYTRTTTTPTAPPGTTSEGPWLLNMRFAGEAGVHTIYYGSFIQGLEDSALAPIAAVNRGEPPAATRTWQVDAGIRYAPDEQLTLISGIFDIRKPYLNIDGSGIYRSLGRLRNRGLETSITYKAGGLTLVGGTVLLRPEVSLSVPTPIVTGSEPLGPVPLTVNLNVDYAPVFWGPWAASLQLNYLSSRFETSDDRYQLPPLTTVALGARHRWARDRHSWTLRVDASNLTNAQGLHLSSLGIVLPELGRRIAITLGADL